jgi:hypothetical protein
LPHIVSLFPIFNSLSFTLKFWNLLNYKDFHSFLQLAKLLLWYKPQMALLRDHSSMARILIIEDDEEIEMRSLLENVLKDEGYGAHSANNGSDFLQTRSGAFWSRHHGDPNA